VKEFCKSVHIHKTYDRNIECPAFWIHGVQLFTGGVQVRQTGVTKELIQMERAMDHKQDISEDRNRRTIVVNKTGNDN